MLRFQGKGKPKGTWEEPCGGLWGREVGVCEEEWGGREACLCLVGEWCHHRLLVGAIRKGDSRFLIAEKKCLSSLWHHCSRGPGLASQSLLPWVCASSTPNSRNVGKVLISN